MILHNGKLEEVTDEDSADWYVNTMDEEIEADPLSLVPNKKSFVKTQQNLQTSQQDSVGLSPEERMSQFRELMNDIVGQAIANNNEALSEQIGKDVQERVLKEMNFLMREQDEAQEERYRKLDAAIRGSARRKVLFSKKKNKE